MYWCLDQREKKNKVECLEDHKAASARFRSLEKYQVALLEDYHQQRMTVEHFFSLEGKSQIILKADIGRIRLGTKVLNTSE